ncbi:hypothetical protein NIIDMKKI_65900 [Mycobacterium kansasii]|uniref:DoxX family protein n=1 Tax=Mycobacterium kansasii TaxID=1768 RepID=A0A7G1ILV5_MYCKA|nr:hypothetical protein NIIDMKKI_65900 [Mycobacterium kansasii]
MRTAGVRRGTELLFSPGAPPETGGLIALAGLRLLAGLIWLYNVVWKLPPDFGQRSNSGLYHFTHLAIEHPVFKPFSWAVEHLVLPYFTAFGWAVLVAESALAVLLLTGTAVRLAALIGIGQSLAIGLSVAESPGNGHGRTRCCSASTSSCSSWRRPGTPPSTPCAWQPRHRQSGRERSGCWLVGQPCCC